jgi:hypothetical protein
VLKAEVSRLWTRIIRRIHRFVTRAVPLEKEAPMANEK